MTNPAEAAQPLYVEEALIAVTRNRSDRHHEEVRGPGLKYPARLGSLAVERLRFDPDYDVQCIVDGVKADFIASYKIDDPEAADVVRQRSMAWLDHLSQNTNLNVHRLTYIGLAATAAEHGDAETVRKIVEDPKRLWLDKHAGIPMNDPDFGKFDRLSTVSIAGKLYGITWLMAAASEEGAEQVQTAVMPTFRDVVTEFVSRDTTYHTHDIEFASDHLLAIATPEAIEQMDKLLAAIPMTPARLDVLAKLAERDSRFAEAAATAKTWHEERASLAQDVLAQYMTPYSEARSSINYQATPEDREDGLVSHPVAAAIVDHIPADGSDTSAIETSVAYASGTAFGGSVHGDILYCVRKLTGNARFAFADPKFGFAATFDRDERSYAHGRVTVVDANVPDGRIVIDLSSELFRYRSAYNEARSLCRIIQIEKNRRASIGS